MEFKSVSENEWGVFSSLEATTKRIRDKSTTFIDKLKELHDGQSFIGVGVINITRVEDGSRMADVVTPLGRGQITFAWELSP